MVRLLVACIRLYQRTLSPLLGNHCRFYPSCSQYAVEALQTHGVFRGTAYAAWRRHDHALAEKAWRSLLTGEAGRMLGMSHAVQPVERGRFLREATEVPWISTGLAAQWSLAVILCLALVPAALPDAVP